MKTNYLKLINNSIKNWYLPLIGGIIFIGVGVLVLMTPHESYLTLSIIFSISFLISGILDVVFSISNRNEMEGWGWNLALGLLNMVIGFILIIHPGISIVILGVIFSIILIWNPVFAGLSLIIWTALAFIVFGVYSIMLSFKLKKLHDIPKTISGELKKKFNDVKLEVQKEILDQVAKLKSNK